jgi:hypothetical protein
MELSINQEVNGFADSPEPVEPNENNSKYQAVIPVNDISSIGGLQREIHAIHFRKDPASTNGFRLPNCQ